MAKIDTRFMTKTAETIPFVAAHTYIAHIREYPPPLRGMELTWSNLTVKRNDHNSFTRHGKNM